MSEFEVHISAADAARRLDVSGTGLRRLADIYDRVHLPLARDPKTNNRIWTLSAVERLEAARMLLRSGRAASVEAALGALEEGAEPSLESISTPAAGVPQGVALGVLIDRFAALERDNAELRAMLGEMLEAQQAQSRQLAALPQERDESETARMNRYLLGELERRRLETEGQTKTRPWWKRLIGR